MTTKKDFLGIANVITLVNILVAVAGFLAVAGGNLELFVACFVICLVLDSLDGWYARLTKTESTLGFYLDSAADTLSFGVLVAVFLNLVVFNHSAIGLFSITVYLLANLARHVFLVKPDAPRVLGATNLVAGCLIVSVYQANLISISSQSLWVALTLLLSTLMLVPVEFLNHKRLKCEVFSKSVYHGLTFMVPLLLLFGSSQFLWRIAVAICILYITLGPTYHLVRVAKHGLVRKYRTLSSMALK